jgi:DNA repair exonuclease SbcCD ATPase subunit
VSLSLRRIALNNFRKFRQPIEIEGLSDGLNIVIEANEAGKSTLLEALRAAFFVRYNTKNQLAQSYAPHGEAVGPEVEVEFEIDEVSWSVTKRFLRSPMVEIDGPQGRAQGEEAEARLNALLGSVRDTSRGGDVSTYGALGLLWVAQTEALAVVPPGQLVRDALTSTLEAEVGSIMGGPAYRRVRDRIDEQFAIYWTPTGQKRGRQNDARERLETATAAAQLAADRLAALEKTFADLEDARTRIKTVERDIADEVDTANREKLVAALEVARAAAQILATRRAEQEAASAKFRHLDDLRLRHEQAVDAHSRADAALAEAKSRRADLASDLATARKRLADSRIELEAARTARQSARVKLSAGEELRRARSRRAAIRAARERLAEVVDLERQYREAKEVAATLIAPSQLESLEILDRAVAEAQAAMNAGATRISFTGPTEGVLIDGQPVEPGERTVVQPTAIHFGSAELVVTPPASAGAAEEFLVSAFQKRLAAFDELRIEDLAAARSRNDEARDAAANLKTLEARIQAATPAEPVIELASGAEALKAFLSEQATEEDFIESSDDIIALSEAMEEAEDALAKADGVQESAIEALRRLEEQDAPLAAAEAGAARDLQNARAQIDAIESRTEFATLASDLSEASARAAQASVKLEGAIRDAAAHDPASIGKKIDIIDARRRSASETRNKLMTEIARFENTIEIEGGAGLADRAAIAQDELEAARIVRARVESDADVLKLLRNTLEDARNETSAKFVGPIAAKTKRYVHRLFPASELTFSDDLALASIARTSLPEDCKDLSQGTQEQLAVLTRIAFADMLAEQGQPVSLILDDPLVYSDDARLDLMLEIVVEVSRRMQVILLTCRDRAFRHVEANRLTFAKPANP